MAIQARKDMDNSVGLGTYTLTKVNAESGLCLIPQVVVVTIDKHYLSLSLPVLY